MGRSLPPATQIALDQLAEMRPFYDALRRSDQLILDEFFEAILQQRFAIANAANLLPMEIIALVIQLEERKRSGHIYAEIYNRIRELEQKLK